MQRRQLLRLGITAAPALLLGCERLREGFARRACTPSSRTPTETLAFAYSLVPELERNLKENILGFWLPRCLDQANGGYLINFRPDGRPNGKTSKGAITQSRMVWLFSRAAREGYGGPELLQAAGLGYRFLRDKMWDPQHGGFFWEVDATGDKVIRGKKHICAQSFALFALSEYHRASKDQEALDLATRLFQLLEAKSHDSLYGGYIEHLNQDWTPTPPSEIGYMGMPAAWKSMNCHMHATEALTIFYPVSHLPLARERLMELIAVQSNTVVRKSFGACTDPHDRDWRPRLQDDPRVSYGHDLENISRLIDATHVVGLFDHLFLDLYQALFAYSREHGYDQRCGGFYESGPLGKAADQRDKEWWRQAEALLCCAKMYQLTRDIAYLDVFNRTWEFVRRYQVDWKNGEWFERVKPDGTPLGDKGWIWKAGYHNGWAMLESAQILRTLRSG